MKVLTTTLFGILLFTSKMVDGQTDQYHPFEENVTWRYDLHTDIPYPTFHCVGNYYYHYYLEGDTIIDNLSYKKLYRSLVASASGGNSTCFPYYTFYEGFVGGVREDMVNNQVFFNHPEMQVGDTLMYDYTLDVGDTIATYLQTCYSVIESIDSVLVDGSYRKRWHYDNCFSGGESGYYIQGYGGSFGLIEWRTNLQQASLICIKKNGVSVFETGVVSNFGCNDIYVEIEEQLDSKINIYPVPTNANIKVDGIPKEQLQRIEIVNQVGQVLETDFTIDGGSIVLETQKLANGIYFLRVYLSNSITEKRFVVKR